MTTIEHESTLLRVASPDGAEIAGRVEGHGPPIVLIPGGPSDGESSWRFLTPLLTGHLTCYRMSTRGRGLSGPHPDQSRERLVEDVVAFIERVGEPVGLFGHSSGGTLALEAAARTDAVSALALYEPYLQEFTDDRLALRAWDAAGRAMSALEQCQPAAAAEIFLEGIALANDEELEIAAAAGTFDILAPNLPLVVQELARSGRPALADPGVVERISVPVLLLHGSRTHPFYVRVVEHLARRMARSQVREIAGAGHLGPQMAPEPIAEELTRFLAHVGPAPSPNRARESPTMRSGS